MSTMISVENVSKKYRLGLIGGGTLREDLARWWARLRKQPDPHLKIGQEHLAERMGEEFWALKDVSFEVKQGEVLGIIGRNGAGKSTLLKILSRVTAPTTGRIRLAGRVASLLEVGTGFHPELTGRENTYLNGAILGMTKREIDRKFDEIVAFSEVEQFIDTPVKRYSSGMYVRLAFAVAAHLDPEILIVDEVLAVGDAAFQRKCLGKMGDAAKGGRTVLFVSHNLSSVSELCSSGLLLQDGLLDARGLVAHVVDRYAARVAGSATTNLDHAAHADRPQRYGRLKAITLLDDRGSPSTTFRMGSSLRARIRLAIHTHVNDIEVGLKISSRAGLAIHYFCTTWEGLRADLAPGVYEYSVTVPEIHLLPASYMVGVWLGQERGNASDDYVPEVTPIDIVGSDLVGVGADFARYSVSGGEVYARSVWAVTEVADG